VREAREYIGEPRRDPLFVRNERALEHRNVHSPYTAEHVDMLR
jgi:hypothetical protein